MSKNSFDKKHREIRIYDSIDSDAFAMLDTALSIMERLNNKPVTIYINSSGGDFYDGLAMHDRIKDSNLEFNAIVYGVVMSSAILPFIACDNRYMSENSFLCWHHLKFQDEEGSRVLQALTEAKQSLREQALWCRLMEKVSDKNYKFWLSKGKEADYYLGAQECLKMKLIHKIL